MYVDQFGSTVRTATETVVYAAPPSSEAPPAATTAAADVNTETPKVVLSPISVEEPATSSSPQPETPLPEPTPSEQKPTPTSAVESSKSSVKPSPTPDVPPPSDGGNLHGVAYSPYKSGGGCKSSQEVQDDFALFAKDHGIIRLYGVDCDQVASVYAAAKEYDNKLFLGIFDISQSAIQEAVSAMAAGVNNDWGIVDTVSVGNELVNSGQASPAQVVTALGQARAALKSAGYDGPVVIVDTFVAAQAHPEICEASDYCAVNIHPFFDPNTSAGDAGKFVTTTVGNIRSKLSSDKRIVVTETGWPWQGDSNGAAVPGMDQQTKALSSIKSAYSDKPGDVILFTAFNDLWKKAESGTFMAEQFWGMGGRYSPADKQ